ncbi:MAG TPA: hypothetical protein VIL05_13240 [Thermoclostridium sp.]
MKSAGDISFEYKAERLSLMYTLHAISHLSREEMELLKALRHDISLLDKFKENGTEVVPKIGSILTKFNLNSIQEVIDIVENYKLFELYNF